MSTSRTAEISQRSLILHGELRGKLSVVPKVPLKKAEDLALLYTPGVAEPCRKIAENPESVYTYTGKGNLVAVISDGSAVLGLGNIGPEAGLPVMEGKSLLFKEFGGVDSIPLVLGTQDPEELIRVIQLLAPGLGGINLEDISAPRCFQVEAALKKVLGIPVFHDDQHGTAIVVLAGLINACRKVGKEFKNLRVVVNGAGAAGTAISRILVSAGISDVTVCDRHGILHRDDSNLNWAMADLAAVTNPRGLKGLLAEALTGADVFIGVSAPRLLTQAMVKQMAPMSIIFAMANPDPEILPDEALAAGAAVVATGRSDFPNQVNNVLAFPGIFRGALDVRARDINEAMKNAAAQAIAALVTPQELAQGVIIPQAFHPQLAFRVAMATAQAAMASGTAGIQWKTSELESLIKKNLSHAGTFRG